MNLPTREIKLTENSETRKNNCFVRQKLDVFFRKALLEGPSKIACRQRKKRIPGSIEGGGGGGLFSMARRKRRDWKGF